MCCVLLAPRVNRISNWYFNGGHVLFLFLISNAVNNIEIKACFGMSVFK